MFFKVMEKLKVGFLKSLEYLFTIFEYGIKGAIQFFVGLAFLLSIPIILFINFWKEILFYGVILILAIFVGYLLYQFYNQKKTKYAEKQISKIMDKYLSKYNKNVKSFSKNVGLISNNHYQKPIIEKRALDDQFDYYSRLLAKLADLEQSINSLEGKSLYLKNIDKRYITMFKKKFSDKNISFHLLINYQKYAKELNDFYYKTRKVYHQNMKRVKIGVDGEKRTESEIKSFQRREKFYYLDNAVLQLGKKSFETDFLIISKYGIFSIEVKNIGESGNVMIRITENHKWYKVFSKGDVRPMQDISSQVNYHISMTEGLLNIYKEETNNEVPEVKPMIVLANNKVLLENQPNLPIYRISEFVEHIKSNPVIMNEQQMKDIHDWLLEKQVDKKGYEVYNYNKGIDYTYKSLEHAKKQIKVLQNCIDDIIEEINKDTVLKGDFYQKAKKSKKK